MELMNGRPEDCSGRLEKEIRVYGLLDVLEKFLPAVHHEPRIIDLPDSRDEDYV